MGRLILIRHSLPQVSETEPSSKWTLSPEGERRASTLAVVVAAMKPASIHSSAEAKAMQTAEFITGMTDLTLSVDPGFNEQERSNEPFTSSEDFTASITAALKSPDEHVYGSETVTAAAERFQAALSAAERFSAPGDMAVVSHGTVMAGYIAMRTGLDPVELWQGFGLPGLVVLNWPDPQQIELRQNFD